MDPTVAALIGAGIGTIGTVLAAFVTPVLTSRRAHTARLRELRREVYAEGMRAYSDFRRAHIVWDLDKLQERIFEAQAQINLFGAKTTSNNFRDLVLLMDELIEIAKIEGRKPQTSHGDGKGLVIPETARAPSKIGFSREKGYELNVAHEKFVDAARSDLAMRDWRWQWLRRKELAPGRR